MGMCSGRIIVLINSNLVTYVVVLSVKKFAFHQNLMKLFVF